LKWKAHEEKGENLVGKTASRMQVYRDPAPLWADGRAGGVEEKNHRKKLRGAVGEGKGAA